MGALKLRKPVPRTDRSDSNRCLVPQKPSRRRFITRATAVLGVAAAPLPSLGNARSGELTAAAFRPLVGTLFYGEPLSQSERPLTLKLAEVVPLRASTKPADMVAQAERSFSLRFEARGTGAMQDTYALAHRTLGRFAALLVPNADGSALIATFNRTACPPAQRGEGSRVIRR